MQVAVAFRDRWDGVGVKLELTVARLNRGLSLRSAAQEIGIARETLASAERGASVHPATAKRIADFYGVTVTDIWPVDSLEAA